MADLLKCPFCGGEAKLRHYEDIKKDFVSVYQYYIECTNCKTQSGWKANVEDAESAWNTRKPMETVVAELSETGRKFCENVGCSKECENCEHGALMRTIIEIVRGKE